MNKKTRSIGFAYTSFAILSTTILVGMVFSQVYQPSDIQTANAERIGDASFFIDSVFSDMDRSLSIASRRSLTGAIGSVVTSGDSLDRPETNITEILVNGTLGGEEVSTVEDASLRGWSDKVQEIGDRSGYNISLAVKDYSLNSSSFSLYSSFKIRLILEDPTTLARFNRTEDAETTVSVEGLEDPLLTVKSRGRYVSTVEKCGFDEPVEYLYSTGKNSSTVDHGKAVIDPSNGEQIENQNDKVLAATDAEPYSKAFTQDFEAVVLADDYSQPADLNSDYAVDTGSISGIEDGKGVIIDKGDVWRTGFVSMFKDGCYIESEEGPDFLDRLGGDTDNNDGSSGIATLIDVTELPSELQRARSSVGYVYFGNSDRSEKEIKGISDEFPWFYLDEVHVEKWDMEQLVR